MKINAYKRLKASMKIEAESRLHADTSISILDRLVVPWKIPTNRESLDSQLPTLISEEEFLKGVKPSTLAADNLYPWATLIFSIPSYAKSWMELLRDHHMLGLKPDFSNPSVLHKYGKMNQKLIAMFGEKVCADDPGYFASAYFTMLEQFPVLEPHNGQLLRRLAQACANVSGREPARFSTPISWPFLGKGAVHLTRKSISGIIDPLLKLLNLPKVR